MRFQVPQFTEVEDKIFGPLTLKQFIYLAGGGGISFLFYVIFPFWLTIIFATPVVVFVLALAFYKINNQPFIKVVENAINYNSSSRLYLWKKDKPKNVTVKTTGSINKSSGAGVYAPKLTNSKLKDLAWSLDIKK
ncbi:MAG: PrgI family protein [Parcubacteria group bacterium]|nr:PrgI family protein [Parcubacteria group bacterium]MCR4342734.1 PrgI family protein [Patescibacteria group bacterium]